MLESLCSNKEKNIVIRLQWKLFIAVLLFVGIYQICEAQVNYIRSGTQFTTALTDIQTQYYWWNRYSSDTAFTPTAYPRHEFYILGVNEACVRIKVPHLNFDTTLYVARNSVEIIDFSEGKFYPFELPHLRTVIIESSRPVNVIGAQRPVAYTQAAPTVNAGANATFISPDDVYQKAIAHFFFSNASPYSMTNALRSAPQFYQIISVSDSNKIEIKFSMSTDNPEPNAPFPGQGYNSIRNLVINKGEVINYRPTGSGLVGQKIELGYIASEKGIKLLMLPTDLRMEGGQPSWGAGYEEYRPAQLYRANFHMAPFAGNSGNLYAFLANKDSTVLTINGRSLVLDSLERYDTCMAEDLVAKSNKTLFASAVPCVINGVINSNFSSRFLVHLFGDDELVTESLFTTINEPDFDNNYILGVSMHVQDTSLFRLDGQPLPSGSYNLYTYDGTWAWANVVLDTGVHIASNPNGFHGYHYTHFIDTASPFVKSYPSYGYGLAQNIRWPEDSLQASIGLENKEVFLRDFNKILCPGDSLKLLPPSDRFTTWEWEVEDTIIRQRSGEHVAHAFYYKFEKAGNIWVSLRDSLGCAQPDSVLIVVQEAPQAKFEYSLLETCAGLSLKLDNRSSKADRYQWQLAGQTSTEFEPLFSIPSELDSIPVKLIVSNGVCSDSIVTLVDLSRENPKQPLPNFLTPNGDGVNDALCFEPYMASRECFSVIIYDRWGKKVYSSENPQKCWRPGAQNSGVYFYVLEVAGEINKANITVFGS